MIGYSGTTVFSEGAKLFLNIAERVVAAMPEEDGLRCHEVARVVATAISRRLSLIDVRERLTNPVWPEEEPGMVKRLYVIDGHYGAAEHSWLLTRFYRHELKWWMVTILDTYAVGRLPTVQMLDPSLGMGELYRPGPTRTDIRRETISRLASAVEAKLE